jgi:tRNA G18 (ribose-2'-O)-methylase SpoU
MSTQRKIVVVAHNIRSLWNVGSLFRTSDAFAVSEIILTGYTPTPPRKELSKIAIGAEKTVPWKQDRDLLSVIRNYQSQNFAIHALEIAENARVLHKYHDHRDCLLVIGNEISGVPDDIIKICDAVLSIPMLGSKESLNVSVAAGIALHHLRFH